MLKLRHKFNNKICESDGIKFRSKSERKYYHELKLQKQTGKVVFFLMQVPFHLPGNVKWVCDFLVFWSDDTVTIVDIKGYKTDMYKAKKKLVEAIYGITITEITY